VVEKLASYTVRVTVYKNTQIGTGALIVDERLRYILTAEHVIKGADASDFRFFLRPNSRES
jgi:S1-C subfamily serine protease